MSQYRYRSQSSEIYSHYWLQNPQSRSPRSPASPPLEPDWRSPQQPQPQPRQPAPNPQLRQPPTPSHLPLKRRRAKRRRPAPVWLAGAGGGMLALAALVVIPRPQAETTRATAVCQEKVQAQSVLSRDELGQLLAIPERSSREAVRDVIEAPYCTLSPVSVREGAQAEREAYPLEFDPQTWFIVLYEEGEYAGYDFSFRRD